MDSFFELSGNSILLTQLLAIIKDELNLEYAHKDIIEVDYVYGLAILAEGKRVKQKKGKNSID